MATKGGGQLSALGKRVERVLQAKLREMEKDIADSEKAGVDDKGKPKREPKYSLTDLTKVWDRALKLEAIRNRVADDGEGGFYGGRDKGAD